MIQLDRGACRDVDSAVFDDEPGDEAAEAVARRVCSACPVRLECLTLALGSRQLDGIWGGLTATERARFVGTDQFGPSRRR